MLQKIINNKFFIFILCILIAGITTCHVGPSSDWDLVSYHYYNAYAVLHNRIGIDIMPAGIQSYLNPLLDIINYLIITTFHNHTKIVMFLLGIPLGFLYFAVYLISDLLFSKVSEDNVVNFLLKIFAVYVGVTECLITAEIAKSYNDIPVSAMVLFALYLCMKFFQNQKGAYLIFTGLLLGCA